MPYINDYIWVSLIAFAVSVILTPIIRRKSRKSQQALDFPIVARKIHTLPIPRIGGIAIYSAFFFALLPAFLGNGVTQKLFEAHVDVIVTLWLTSSLVFLIGLYDDFRGASVAQKFAVQILAALLAYLGGLNVEVLSIPFVGSVSLGVLGLPVTVLWFVGVTNALNFIDGIDGLACGVGFFSVSTMFIISLFLHHPLTAFFAAALAGGLFGFALYNFNPASIFMGDSGSLFVGFVIAAISLQGAQKSSTAVILLLPIVVLGVPIADTLLAIVRRVGNGLSPFSADKEHIHHRLLKLGLSSRQVVLILYLVCSLLGTVALLMTAVNNQMLTVLLLVLSVMTIGGMRMLGYTSDMVVLNSMIRERIRKRRDFLHRQRFTEHLLTEIRAVVDAQTFEKTLVKYCENMELDLSELRVTLKPGGKPLKFRWWSPRYESRQFPILHMWTMTFPLLVNERVCGQFRVGSYALEQEQELSVDNLCFFESLRSALEEALNTLARRA